jgi:hypothetical protein
MFVTQSADPFKGRTMDRFRWQSTSMVQPYPAQKLQTRVEEVEVVCSKR